MVKNIIFDVGMVLVNFDWAGVLKELGFSGEEFEAVADATVRTPQWDEFDRSAISDEELLESFLEKAPNYQEQIHEFWNHMDRMITQYPYAKEWIGELKEAGYRIYILSNYARRTYELTKDTGLNFLPLVDGALFSFQVGRVKPEPEIYELLMEQYGLKPQECVFIDDNPRNLVYPQKLGWRTIQFTEISTVRQRLKEIL